MHSYWEYLGSQAEDTRTLASTHLVSPSHFSAVYLFAETGSCFLVMCKFLLSDKISLLHYGLSQIKLILLVAIKMDAWIKHIIWFKSVYPMTQRASR